MKVLRKWHYLSQAAPFDFPDRELVFVCVGTDRCTGDCLGPLVGRYLKGFNIPNVYGCLSNPIHAMNIEECLLEIETEHHGACVIGVDAALGSHKNVGYITLKNGPLAPGKGVGKKLPGVGEYAITATVNVSGINNYETLSHTRLGIVDDMAVKIAQFILDSLAVSLSEVAATKAV